MLSARLRHLLKSSLLSFAILLLAQPYAHCSDSAVEEISATQEPKWNKPFEGEATDMMMEFTRAMKGKAAKESTRELMRGVIELTFLEEGLMFTRCDNERLLILKNSEEGKRLTEDWDKAQKNAEKQFGPSGKEFLAGIKSIKQDNNRIEINRCGKGDLLVDLGKKKLHHAFDLKAIRFSKINFEMGTINGHPALLDLNGVTVLINAPGFTLPVQVKQFCKWKKSTGELDVTVGVKTPIPGAIRTLLFLPRICQFHFSMPKKPDEDNDKTPEHTASAEKVQSP